MTVVNFATNHFKVGQKRLSDSLNGHKQLMIDSYTAIHSPTHQQSPYEFKVHAIEKAFELDPVVLWADSSFWLVGDLSEIENIILEDGYFMTEAGHYVGRWVNEFQRKYFNLTTQELKQGPGGMIMFSAGLVGLHKDSPIAMEFLKQWKKAAVKGAFRGRWEDTRHDQTAGSIIAQRLGMKYQNGPRYMSYIGDGYEKPHPQATFYLQGI